MRKITSDENDDDFDLFEQTPDGKTIITQKDDFEQDYDFARKKYRKLVKDSNEAIELMMNVARDSEHPRAFEVLSNMLKQNAEIADRLIELQKSKKEIEGNGPGVTNNNLFIGSTTELQKFLKGKSE